MLWLFIEKWIQLQHVARAIPHWFLQLAEKNVFNLFNRWGQFKSHILLDGYSLLIIENKVDPAWLSTLHVQNYRKIFKNWNVGCILHTNYSEQLIPVLCDIHSYVRLQWCALWFKKMILIVQRFTKQWLADIEIAVLCIINNQIK